MTALYYIIAFTAGIGITLQTTLNSQLARGLGGDPVTAALFSFAAGAFSLAIFSLLRGGLVSSLTAIASQPLWSLAGGLIGACALFSYVVLAPKIGFSALLGLAIVGQLLSSQVIDHFGLLGATVRPVSQIKLGGTLVMLAGLTVMLFGERGDSFVRSCLETANNPRHSSPASTLLSGRTRLPDRSVSTSGFAGSKRFDTPAQ